MSKTSLTRDQRKELKQKLLASGSPRLQMTGILLLTGLAGFAASALLHALGLEGMALRYLIATAVAYLAFLLCLHLWVRYVASRELSISIDADTIEDVVDIADEVRGLDGTLPRVIPARGHSSSGDLKGLGDLFSIDLDEGAIVVIVAVLLLALAAVAVYFIAVAPAFLGEIVADAFLLGGLYRRVKKLQASDWLPGAIRGSVFFFAVVALIFAGGGFLIQHIDPAITTFGEALRAASAAWQ